MSNFKANYTSNMKHSNKLFSLAAGVATVIFSGLFSGVEAQSKTTYVGANGTVYENYHGKGEISEANDDGRYDVYCYQCRAFHKSYDFSRYHNRANVHGCHEGEKCNMDAHCKDGGACAETMHCTGGKACPETANCHPDYADWHESGAGYGEACHGDACHTCGDHANDLYNMDHEYDHSGKDYVVKYRGNKVKVKCASCNAKWKYYHSDYDATKHYIYDNNDRVIVSYTD